MSKKPPSLFSRKPTESLTSLTVKIPTELKDRLANISKQVKALDSDLRFDLSQVVQNELEKIAKRAEKELEQLEEQATQPDAEAKQAATGDHSSESVGSEKTAEIG